MNYKIVFLPDALEDFQRWKRTDEKTVLKIKEILQDIAKHPFTGIGKPEPLKHNLTGKWSRRINKTDRIIYSVNGTEIIVYVFSMKGHY